MKLLLSLITVFSGITLLAAPPPPPTMLGQVGAPTNGFWTTNITFVYTNAAARTPSIDLGQVTIYASNTIDRATCLAWTPPTNTPTLTGYKLYYGQASGGATNKFTVSSNITAVVFFSTLTTNVPWWAYVTAFTGTDTNIIESVPSAQILFTPLR